MPTITIRVRKNPRKKLVKLKDVLRKGGTAMNRLLFVIGRAVLEKVHPAFVTKSEGGTDESGLRWAPLAPYTVDKKRRLKAKRPSISLDTLTETQLLIKSLTPPSKSARGPSRRKDQVFNVTSDGVEVGTTREWAWTHHHGVPGRIPQRRLWPEVANWPRSWWEHIGEAAKMELVEIITKLLR